MLRTLSLSLFALAGSLSAQTGVATYEVVFDATWSATSLPGAFPFNAHFSALIGAVHSDAVSLWEPGGIATPGIEIMAETGGTGTLTSEINALISQGTALERISGNSAFPPVMVSDTFEVTTEHSQVSVVTMIAPSPDWFVGVHGLELFENGRFVDEITVPLFAYDSGTDAGVDFTSGNSDVTPHEPIEQMTMGPFFGTTPLGTFTFRRLTSNQTYGSGLNPAGSLTLVGDTPVVGGTVTYSIDDPTGTMASPAVPVLFYSGQSAPGFPNSGVMLANFGMAGAGMPSELLIMNPLPVLQSVPQWTSGQPVDFTLSVPNDPSLAGQSFFLQGALADGLRFGLTEANAATIGE